MRFVTSRRGGEHKQEQKAQEVGYHNYCRKKSQEKMLTSFEGGRSLRVRTYYSAKGHTTSDERERRCDARRMK